MVMSCAAEAFPSCTFTVSENDCSKVLQRLRKNPPKNTKVDVNIRLSKARYRCREGFKLVGQEIRTCKKGRWKEKQEPKCLGDHFFFKETRNNVLSSQISSQFSPKPF